MKPVAAALAGALISGAAMYTVGARTATVDAFTASPATVQPADQFGSARSATLTSTSQPAARPVAFRSTPARRTVTRSVQPASERVVYREEPNKRSWQKSALIIGGSAASGAGVGAIVGGSKGALIGAAIGGGASSIYEATRRR
jgi:hypothetical protein